MAGTMYWPSKLAISGSQFDAMASDTLFEWIGPWFFGALEVGAQSRPPEVFQLAGSAYWVWTEAAGGGIEQYFTNLAVGLPFVSRALRVLGRNSAADLIEKATKLLPGGFMSWDLDARSKFASTSRELRDFSEAFWAALDEEEFPGALAEFVRAHRREFLPYFSDIIVGNA